MKMIFAIGLGSFLGGICRYLLSLSINQKTSFLFPWGTLCVNILGCLLIGFLFGFAEKSNLSEEWRTILAVGFLGGFTTFSAFSWESLSLIRNEQWLYALLYVFSSLFFGFIATSLGYYVTRS